MYLMYLIGNYSLLKKSPKKCQAFWKVITVASELQDLKCSWDYKRSHHEVDIQDCSWKVLPLWIIQIWAFWVGFFFFHFAESNMCSLDYTLHLSGEVKERHCSWTTTTTKSCQTEHSKQFQFRWKGCSCSPSSDLKIVFYVSRQVFNWKCNLTIFNRGKEKCTGFSIVRPIKMKS